MKYVCDVCGKAFSDLDKCPVCKFPIKSIVGSGMNEEQKAIYRKRVGLAKEKIMKDIKVYIRGYHWEEENGQMVEKFHEDILIAENVHTLDFDQNSWSEVEFAKQTAGETVELTVVVENGGSKTNSLAVKAPDTGKEMWKVGFALKPGLNGVVKVGAGNNIAESKEFSLKG